MGETLDEGRAGAAAALLEEAFRWMDKALRSLSIYDAGHQVARAFRTSTGQHFVEITEQEGETWIDVRAKSLCCGEQEIYREDPKSEGFVFRMHRDGVRRLCLLPGLSLSEVERLVAALQTDLERPEQFDNDMVTLLWEAELEHVRFIVADLLTQAPEQAEDLRPYQDLMNRIIAAATAEQLPEGARRRDLASIRLSAQAFGDLDPEQLAATLDVADEGSVDPFGAMGPELDALRAEYDDPRTLARFVEILYRSLALVPERAQGVLGSFELLVQALLRSGRVEDLLEVVRSLGAFGQELGDAAGRMVERVFLGANVSAMLRLLAQGDAAQPSPVLDLLRLAPAERCGEILAAAAPLTDVSRDVAEILAELAADRPALVAPNLESREQAEVQLALDVLLTIGTEEALDCLRPLRQHPQPDMRIWLLRLTQDLRSPAVAAVRRAMLEDPSARVRAEAERCLARHADPELVKRLLRRLADGSLKEQSFAEKRRVCTMLGSFGGPREVRLLKELVQRGRVLGGRRQVELCAAAAHGLAATDDRAHLELLEQTAGRRLMARQVREACREAAEVLRQGRRSRSSQVRPIPELVRQAGALDEDPADGAAAMQRAAPAPVEDVGPAVEDGVFGGSDGYGFVDIGQATDPPAAGATASRSSGEVAQLLRAYLDRDEPSPGPTTEDGGEDAVAELLQRYLEDTDEPPAGTARPEVDDLLRRYVEEDEP